MRQKLIEIVKAHDPKPAGGEVIERMVNAGEERVALEMIAENYFEHGVALTEVEKAILDSVANEVGLGENYKQMFSSLAVRNANS